MQIERGLVVLGTKTILRIFCQQHGQDVDATHVGAFDKRVEMLQWLVHAIVWVSGARATKHVVVQKDAHGIDTERMQAVHVRANRRDIPGAIAVGSKMQVRAAR